MINRYEEKIARIRAGQYQPGDFIIADAKDADVTGGILTTGVMRERDGKKRHKTRREFLDQMAEIIAQEQVDILLASAGNMEALKETGCFKNNGVQPAFRANETTDIWGNIRGGRYQSVPSIPYRGANLLYAPANLCLYSITLNNNAEEDVKALEAYALFRQEAHSYGLKHFLEVFNPNMENALEPNSIGAFMTDSILRLMASLTKDEKPEFLKIAYNGHEAMQDLAGHDPDMIVGVLGGRGATTRDTFELVAQSEAAGARLALFGRKINQAEHQCTLIAYLRKVADRQLGPEDAVRAYHEALNTMNIPPNRGLDEDIKITDEILRAEAVK